MTKLMSVVSAVFMVCLGSVMSSTQSSKTPTLDEPFQGAFTSLSHVPCVTLFHRNGRLGCGTASRDNQVGRLVFQDGESSFANLKEPYVVVMREETLSRQLVENMQSDNGLGYWQGVLVLNTSIASESYNYYSPGAADPQGRRTPSQLLNYGNSGYKWNANGDQLLQFDFRGVPMVYVADPDVSEYLEVTAQTDLTQSSRVMAEFNYYMGPVNEMNSPTCLGWHDASDGEWNPKCKPLGGTSVWAVAGSPEASQQQRRERRLNDNAEADDADAEDNGADDNNDNNNNGQRPVFIVATNMDSTSQFHDSTPGANTAAANILTTLMAAKLVGESLDDATLDGLSKRIMFAFFQAETFGFVGSRAFLRDVAYPGFQCGENLEVPAVAKDKNSTKRACLYPLRPSLDFADLGEIAGMLTVDQVGVLATAENYYVHYDEGDFGGFLSNVLQASSPNGYTVNVASDINGDDDHFDGNDVTVPPTPLTSLLSLSEGAVGGAVLAGYDANFAENGYYHSHLDSTLVTPISLESIATAATLLARTAVAAAYDDGDMDSDTASQYAVAAVDALEADEETLVKLSECLFVHGTCELLFKYVSMEVLTLKKQTGFDMNTGYPLGNPPNYYAGVYSGYYGQPFVAVDGKVYGAFNGDPADYGKHSGDAFGLRPKFLEVAIHGLMNDFLGRGSANEDVDFVGCSSTSDCSSNKIEYCASSDQDSGVCSGSKVCVCSRAHYHLALDESLEAAPGNVTGMFQTVQNDEEISAMYTEPDWSTFVGVKIYKDAGNMGGTATLVTGIISLAACVVTTLAIRKALKRQMLY